MKTLPDHLELIGADLEHAARGSLHRRRQRTRRIQVAALVAATAILGTGVGLAASGVDLLGWLREEDPTEARYLADTTTTYTGPAPDEVECDSVNAEPFLCRPIPSGPYECPPARRNAYPCSGPGSSKRIYVLNGRVEDTVRITRDLLLDSLADAGNEGMSDRLEQRFRNAFEDVSPEFLAKLDLLTRIQGSQTLHEGPDGGYIAPPPGVPIQITCHGVAESTAIRCRDVSGATDIPLGAPVYTLLPTKDWVPYEPSSQEERWAEIVTFFGRPLTADENLVFLYLGIAEGMSEAEWAQVERALDQMENER